MQRPACPCRSGGGGGGDEALSAAELWETAGGRRLLQRFVGHCNSDTDIKEAGMHRSPSCAFVFAAAPSPHPAFSEHAVAVALGSLRAPAEAALRRQAGRDVDKTCTPIA